MRIAHNFPGDQDINTELTVTEVKPLPVRYRVRLTPGRLPRVGALRSVTTAAGLLLAFHHLRLPLGVGDRRPVFAPLGRGGARDGLGVFGAGTLLKTDFPGILPGFDFLGFPREIFNFDSFGQTFAGLRGHLGQTSLLRSGHHAGPGVLETDGAGAVAGVPEETQDLPGLAGTPSLAPGLAVLGAAGGEDPAVG